MATLALGIGSSHSPMVSLIGSDWVEWGKRDFRHPLLYTEDGRHVQYDAWAEECGAPHADKLTREVCDAGAARVAAAVDVLRDAIAAAALDALVVVGDDQDEQLKSDNLPPFVVFWGDTLTNNGGAADDAPAMMRRIALGYREPDRARDYPVATALARHLIDRALDGHFDVAASNRLPRGEAGMGHAFGFVVRRLLASETPVLPIMVNTYNPPTQPRTARCIAFGTLLREAIESFGEDLRVGVLASGGLSHFIVMEELDRRVLAALAEPDLDALAAIPEATLQSGTSEIKNWITVASACRDCAFELVDYVPGYRTPAGTGTGLAFALWRPEG